VDVRAIPARWWLAADAAAGGLLAAAMIRSVHVTAGRATAPAGFGVLLAGLLGVAVATRRLAPVPIFLLAAAATSLLASWGFVQDPMVGLALVLYAVSAACTLAWSIPALAVGWLTVAVSARLPAPVPLGNDRVVSTLAVLTAAAAMGTALRTQRRYASGLLRQAQTRAQAAADRAERTRIEERLRIARELHDVIAHTMSVITVQAGVGAYVAARQPAAAARALATIEDTGRSAMDELRRILTVLRADTDPGIDGADAPAPGLAALPGLVDAIRQTGLTITLSVTGRPRPLPAGIDLAGYRIVQEALTNVIRHARAATASVAVAYQPGNVHLAIADDGAGRIGSLAQPLPAGHGLTGMAERAALCGGQCVARPGPRGFEVIATLPLRSPATIPSRT
jgi:signal transduction histidine kinase